MSVGSSDLILSCCYLVRSGRNLYSSQLSRLASFTNWPHLGKQSAWACSSAGLFGTGRGDEVTCFTCGLTLRSWTAGMHPLTVHRELCDGRCDFVCDQSSSGDLPLGSAKHLPLSGGQLLRKSQPAAVAEAVCSSAASPAAQSAADSPELATGSQLADCFASCYTSLPLPQPITVERLLKDPVSADGCHRHRGSNVEASKQHQLLQEEAVKYESYRLRTFSNAWEHSSIVSARELAASGFHYKGPGDRVQCAFCQGLLRNWEHGDRAAEQNALHFTYCRFIQGHDVGNVPIPFTALQVKIMDRKDVAEELGISRSVPKQPDLAVESRRMATFLTWPSIHQHKPEALAKAGFFFVGPGAAVQCFYCDGTVTEWPHCEDPWVEHARRFPSCPFVEQVKGREFILQHNAAGSPSNPSLQRTSFLVDPRELRARMDSPKVRIVLLMDYPHDLVREVIQKQLATVGDDHKTSEDLLADIFAVHDEKQRTSAPRSISGKQHQCGQWLGHLPTAHLPTIVACAKAGGIASVGGTELPGWSLAATAGASAAEGLQLADVPSQPCLTAGQVISAELATKLNPEEENRQLKTQLTCKICMDSLVGILFLPCGHLVCCPACAPALTMCPICRVSIRGTVRTYL